MGEIENYVFETFIKPKIFIQNGKQCILESDIESENYSDNELLMIKNILLDRKIVAVSKKYTFKESAVNKLKSIVYEDAVGSRYIVKSELAKLDLTEEEREYINSKIPNSKISIIDSIKTLERPKKVLEFEYGFINEAKINPADETKFSNIEFNEKGEVVSADFTKLDEYLSEVFIPEHVHLKTLLKDKHGPTYYSIQFNKLTKLQLSELEIQHAMEYLKEQNIIICGTSEYPEEEFENYDYFYRVKHIQVPENVSKEETLEMFKDLRRASTPKEASEIRSAIIVGNMRLAKWVLFKMSSYYNLDSSFDTYAYEGLIKAVDNFDVNMGYYFSTYAVVVIRHFIQNKLCEYYEVSPTIFGDFYRALKIVEANYERKYQLGDTEMLEDILGLLVNVNSISENSKDEYLRRFNITNPAISLSEGLGENVYSDTTVEELVSADNLREDLLKVLGTLTDRENKILQLRFGLFDGKKYKLDEIANRPEYGFCKETIRRTEAKALRRLRHPSRSKKLKPYLFTDNSKTSDFYGNQADSYLYEENKYDDVYDKYYDSEQDSMENPNYKDALEELDELYKEESRKTR